MRPAFLVVEILSEDDRTTKVLERLGDFAAKGVPHIWLIDPRARIVWTYHGRTLELVNGDVIATDNPRLELTRAEIFEDLDD